MPERSPVTQILDVAGRVDAYALGQLLAVLYDELHALAHRQRLRQLGPATINTTALLHEAYLRIARADGGFDDRTHFFRIAAQAMRQILVDYARRRQAEKRGGGAAAATLDESLTPADGRTEEVLALHEALGRLAALSPRQAEIVTMRYFAGFTIPETAELLGCSTATVWRKRLGAVEDEVVTLPAAAAAPGSVHEPVRAVSGAVTPPSRPPSGRA